MTAPAQWRVLGEPAGIARLDRVVDRRDDDPERSEVGGLLDLAFGSLRHADDRHTDPWARGNHLLDVGKRQRAVLHLNPDEVVVRRHRAVLRWVRSILGPTEDLLAIQQLLLRRVVELRLLVVQAVPDRKPDWPRRVGNPGSQKPERPVRSERAAPRSRLSCRRCRAWCPAPPRRRLRLRPCHHENGHHTYSRQ